MDGIWETFDAIFKTCFRQGRRMDELEQRVADLEKLLAAKGATCAACEDAGILADGQTLCSCPVAALVIGPEDELTTYPSAEADDRVALRLA